MWSEPPYPLPVPRLRYCRMTPMPCSSLTLTLTDVVAALIVALPRGNIPLMGRFLCNISVVTGIQSGGQIIRL